MDRVKPSTHSEPSGRRRARATRSRITKAASRLFGERGYSGTTMADIAAAAGVAVQTVYFVFHTKTEVLDSAYSLLSAIHRPTRADSASLQAGVWSVALPVRNP